MSESPDPETDPDPPEETIAVTLEYAGPLRVRDPFLFLIGNRESILRVVRSPWSLLVGVLFVWAAGIARHYDLHELHLVTKWTWAPFLVAGVTSSLVYIVLYLAVLGFSGKPGPGFFHQYASFYAAFLMTAPAAWIYAIPVEHFLDADPLPCAKWNIALLAIVSFWRVALIVRVLLVITKAPWWKILFVVLLPLSAVTLVASFYASLDIVGLMGGAELTPTEEFRSAAYETIFLSSFWIGLVCFVGIWFPIGEDQRGRGRFGFRKQPFPRGPVLVAALVLLAWIAYALPFQLDPDLREPRASLERKAVPQPQAEPFPETPPDEN